MPASESGYDESVPRKKKKKRTKTPPETGPGGWSKKYLEDKEELERRRSQWIGTDEWDKEYKHKYFELHKDQYIEKPKNDNRNQEEQKKFFIAKSMDGLFLENIFC